MKWLLVLLWGNSDVEMGTEHVSDNQVTGINSFKLV